jgi:hypothetical protein
LSKKLGHKQNVVEATSNKCELKEPSVADAVITVRELKVLKVPKHAVKLLSYS